MTEAQEELAALIGLTLQTLDELRPLLEQLRKQKAISADTLEALRKRDTAIRQDVSRVVEILERSKQE